MTTSPNKTLPYLQRQRKDKLTEVAAHTSLHDYENLNKPDLVTALDKHLRQHRDDFHSHPKLGEYYRRLLSPAPPRSTPVKREREREMKKLGASSMTDADAVKTPDSGQGQDLAVTSATPNRSVRRSARKRERGRRGGGVGGLFGRDELEEEIEAANDHGQSEVETPSDVVGPTSAAVPFLFPPVTLSPSLAVPRQEGMDRPTSWIRGKIYDALNESRLLRWLNMARWWLSDIKVIQTLLVAIEAVWIVYHLLPTCIRSSAASPPPSPPSSTSSSTPSSYLPSSNKFFSSFPDLLTLTSGSAIWAPLSLWGFTNVFIPLALAFFCNVSKATIMQNQNRVYSTRSVSKAAEAESDIDLFTFCIARGLVAYVVYGCRANVFFGLVSRSLVGRVNAAAPGRWVGMVVNAVIGAVEVFYQAILRNS